MDRLDLASDHIQDDFFRFRYYPVVSSTQDLAKKLGDSGEPQGTVIIAEQMLAGRGRLSRKWIADPGGIYVSILLRPPLEPSRAPLLGLLSALCVAKSIRECTGLDPRIKWPNDVLISGKKLCGVLAETKLHGSSIDYSVLGIGINVNNLPPIPQATSIKLELGREFPRLILLERMLAHLKRYYFKLISGDLGFLEEFRRICSTLGTRVRVDLGDRILEGNALDLDQSGALILDLGTRGLIRLTFGDVIHLRSLEVEQIAAQLP